MRRLTQRVLADPTRGDGHAADGTPGDCFRACLAMLADVDYELAPHAVMHLSWYERAREFIREHVPGGDLQCYNWDGTTDLYGVGGGRHVIATGPSPRGNFKHCVMADSATGEILHDPHPSRAGLLAIELVDAIVPLNDPANLPMAPMLALPVGGAARWPTA